MQRLTARQYLQIDIANHYGLDKTSWDERLAWFVQHQDHLHEMVASAEEPALFYAAITAWEDVLAGRPIGYPISLDATSSGLQILAALTGDRKAAQLCNVINAGHRSDAYTKVYEEMLARTGGEAKIKRKDAKEAVMTALYGSQAVPKRVFGEGPLLRVFQDTMVELAPAAWDLNQAFLDIWDDQALTNDWVLPDNFHVHVKVMAPASETIHWFDEPIEITYRVNAPVAGGRSLGANVVHSVDGMIVREMTRRCDYDPVVIERVWDALTGYAPGGTAEDTTLVKTLWDHYQNSGYLSARILDHLYSSNIDLVELGVIHELLESLPKKPFKLISVHDCFRCLPNYGNDLREQYNRQLMLIAKSNLLQALLSQLIGRPVAIGKLDPQMWSEIMETDYALS